MKVLAAILFILFDSTALGSSVPATQRNFIACPIVRDTLTVPCWLAEYDGELYYLGIQSDSRGDWYPPSLGHRVLVEGTVSNESRICGGIVLKPNKTSVLPALDASCNTQWPAEDKYTVPFAPRGPGPSSGSLVPPARVEAPAVGPPFQAREFTVPYEFDAPSVTGRTAQVLQQAVRYANAINASHIQVTGYRGAVLLSDGNVIAEKDGIAQSRAKQVSELLQAVGISQASIDIQWHNETAAADGVRDFEQRRVTVLVKP